MLSSPALSFSLSSRWHSLYRPIDSQTFPPIFWEEKVRLMIWKIPKVLLGTTNTEDLKPLLTLGLYEINFSCVSYLIWYFIIESWVHYYRVWQNKQYLEIMKSLYTNDIRNIYKIILEKRSNTKRKTKTNKIKTQTSALEWKVT